MKRPAKSLIRSVVGILVLLVLAQCAHNPKAAPAKQTSAGQEKKAETPPPQTLEEAHLRLEKLLPQEELARIDAMKTEKEMILYHLGLGMGIRNAWRLWSGGPLAQHMNKLGFHHPDDMSGVILETFWCKRHGKAFRLKERAVYYAAYWKAVADPPESAKDPNDGSEVDWTISFGDGDDKTPRQIHVGKSKKTGRWLAYEYDKGVYEPDAALMKRITDSENIDPFAPTEKPVEKQP